MAVTELYPRLHGSLAPESGAPPPPPPPHHHLHPHHVPFYAGVGHQYFHPGTAVGVPVPGANDHHQQHHQWPSHHQTYSPMAAGAAGQHGGAQGHGHHSSAAGQQLGQQTPLGVHGHAGGHHQMAGMFGSSTPTSTLANLESSSLKRTFSDASDGDDGFSDTESKP